MEYTPCDVIASSVVSTGNVICVLCGVITDLRNQKPCRVNSNSWAINLDCVPRSFKSIRLRVPFKWLSSFLSHRSRVVQISNKSSKPIDLAMESPGVYPHLNLTINSSKTNVLIFLRTAGNQYGPEILIADSTLDEVSSSKFLDRGLTWNEHID
ncbi:hypothetical protein J6590_058452, partial [Homalodisca vitripennis]